MAIIFTGSRAITEICSEIKNDLFAQRGAERECDHQRTMYICTGWAFSVLFAKSIRKSQFSFVDICPIEEDTVTNEVRPNSGGFCRIQAHVHITRVNPTYQWILQAGVICCSWSEQLTLTKKAIQLQRRFISLIHTGEESVCDHF